MDLVLEEHLRILEIMGVNPQNKPLLVEGVIPPELAGKLAKFLEEVLEKQGDETTEGIIRAAKDSGNALSQTEIKFLRDNVDEIVRAAKNLKDPTTSVIYRDFLKIATKISKSEMDILVNKAVNKFLTNNPTIDAVITKTSEDIEEIARKYMNGESIDPAIDEYLKNGGNFRDLYESTLKGNGVKGDILEHYLAKFDDESDAFAQQSKNADEYIKDPTGRQKRAIEELTSKNLPSVNFWTKWVSTEWPTIYDIFKSKFGFASSEVATKEVEKIVNDLYKKIDVTKEMQPEEAFNVIKELKSQIKQAENFSKDKTSKEVWGDITAELNKTAEGKTYVKYIEDYSHGDSFESIGYFIDESQKVFDDPGFFKKLKNANSEKFRTEVSSVKKKYGDFADGFKKTESLFLFGKDKIALFIWNLIRRIGYGIFNSRIMNFLLFENARFLREILQSLRRGGLRDKRLYINIIRTWFSMVVTKYVFGVFAVAVTQIINEVKETFGFRVNPDYSNDGWEELGNQLLEQLTVGLNKGFDAFYEKVGWQLLPLGKGPLLELFIDVLYDLKGWKTGEKEKVQTEAERLQQQLESNVAKYSKTAAEVIEKNKNLDATDMQALGVFKAEMLLPSYKLTASQRGVIESLTYRNADNDYFEIRNPKTDIIYNIKLTGEERKNKESKVYLQTYSWDDKGTKKPLKDLMDTYFNFKTKGTQGKETDIYSEYQKFIDKNLNNTELDNTTQNESYRISKKLIMENNGKKFGEDNFKHWKETFTFKSEDKGNPGQFKEVKIKMEDVMDRISHYRKKYDEDDSFVRAVVDTHPDVVKIMYTKGLADINESATPRGLALVLRVIKESRGEMEIFSVARPANGNWFLVKGDYTQSQLANMDLEKKEPKDKEEKKEVSGSEELKKKEQTAIDLLKRNEKEGLNDLPTKVREKLREKMGKGWTTEPMPSFLNKIATESEINTIFNDKIEIYKLESNDETFDAIADNSSQIFIKRGFCRSLYVAADNAKLNEKQEKVVDHILDKCDKKFLGKLGVRNF
jgi:hypothetical protein